MRSVEADLGWSRNMVAAARVQPGERVRIVVDEPLRAEANVLAAVAAAAGGEVRIVVFPAERPLAEPTEELLESARWADVSLSILHETFAEETRAGRATIDALLGHGGRALSCPDIDRETLRRDLSAPMPDLEAPARTLLEALEGARELRLEGAAGTDLVLRVDGRSWVGDCLPLEPGGVANFPGGEICIAPLSDGAEGVLVADLTVPWGPASGLLLPEPVVIEFERGRARTIGGGESGEALRRLMEDAGPGADVIAELGLGLNPAIEPRGSVLFDEKAAGTAHVAIGDNTGPYGGDNVAAIHVDCVLSEPRLTADGVAVPLPPAPG